MTSIYLRFAQDDRGTQQPLKFSQKETRLVLGRDLNDSREIQRGLWESIQQVSVRFADMASWLVGGGIANQRFHLPWVSNAGEQLKRNKRGPGGPRYSRPGGRRYNFMASATV